MRPLTLLLVVATAGLLGCAAATLVDVRFDASAYETALERAVTALERYGNGIGRVEGSEGRIYTRWKDADVSVGRGLVFYRIVATIQQKPSGADADVRLQLETVRCSLMDARDPERTASACPPTQEIPDKVQEHFKRVATALERDLMGSKY